MALIFAAESILAAKEGTRAITAKKGRAVAVPALRGTLWCRKNIIDRLREVGCSCSGEAGL